MPSTQQPRPKKENQPFYYYPDRSNRTNAEKCYNQLLLTWYLKEPQQRTKFLFFLAWARLVVPIRITSHHDDNNQPSPPLSSPPPPARSRVDVRQNTQHQVSGGGWVGRCSRCNRRRWAGARHGYGRAVNHQQQQYCRTYSSMS